MGIKRKGVTTSDIVRAIKGLEHAVMQMQHRIYSVEAVIDKYIELQGNGDEFADFLEKEFNDKASDEEE